MNEPLAEPRPWSPRRWGWTLGSVFVCHLVVLWIWSDRQRLMPRLVGSFAPITLILDDDANRQLNAAVASMDPTLFAQANPHGFSGQAWLRLVPPPHQLRDWTDSDRLLGLTSNTLGAEFRPLDHAGHAGTALVPLNPPPRFTDVQVPDEPLATESSVRLLGDLARRPLQLTPPLPTWPLNEVLSDSIVQLAVNPIGEPISARLWSSCGWAKADAYALETARLLRFQPLASADAPLPPQLPLTWGKLVFQWCTTNAPSTNAPAVPP